MTNIKRTVMVPNLHKIEGVTWADADVHTIDLKGLVPKGTIAISLMGEKILGDGFLECYPWGDNNYKGLRSQNQREQLTVGLVNGVLYCRCTVANDVFDISIHHAWVDRFD